MVSVVNGPLPDDGTYFEPSVTVLEKSQKRYENFLSRKIPKIAEIASRNLKRPIEDPKKEDDEEEQEVEVQETSRKTKKPLEEVVIEGNECKPNKCGSWPKWMNQRSIKKAAQNRRKRVKRIINRERRMNKNKKDNQKIRRKTNIDVEMK